MVYSALKFQPQSLSRLSVPEITNVGEKIDFYIFRGRRLRKIDTASRRKIYFRPNQNKAVPLIVVPNQKKSEEKIFLRFSKNGKSFSPKLLTATVLLLLLLLLLL